MEGTEEKMVTKGSDSAKASSREIENVNLGEEKDPLESKEEERDRGSQYPVRPYEIDCAFYVRTGYCRYGATCRFNHPSKRMGKFWRSSRYCQFYFQPRGCRYGNACKFSHYPEKTDTEQMKPCLISFPVLQEEKDCPQYMQTGYCNSSAICKLQHPPLLTSVASQSTLSECSFEGSTLSGYENAVSGHAASRPLLLAEIFGQLQISNEPMSFSDATPSYMPVMPPYQVYDNIAYQDRGESTSSPSKRNVRHTSAPLTAKADDTVNQQANTEEHPENPVQCNHPNGRSTETATVTVSPMGLPLRPDQPVCMYYSRYGLCKYGIGCQYDHPVGYGTATS